MFNTNTTNTFTISKEGIGVGCDFVVVEAHVGAAAAAAVTTRGAEGRRVLLLLLPLSLFCCLLFLLLSLLSGDVRDWKSSHGIELTENT